jgi:transposase
VASLVKKRKKGHDYWYVVESRRVNGRPRIVWQQYLGTADSIAARARQTTPGPVTVAEFGAVAALWALGDRLDLVGLIDRVVPKRDQGVSIGHYLVLAALNRVVAPTSKAQIGAWYAKTWLRAHWGIPASAFTSQAFWRAMDAVDADALAAIEDAVAEATVRRFGIRVQTVAYDAPNFFTDIATPTPGELAQRGHNKQKRNDLRQVNLALLSTVEGHVPLLHTTYPGDVPDPTAFGQALARLHTRYTQLATLTDDRITVVFDKGNVSQANMTQVWEHAWSVVSTLVPSHHKDLLAIPRTAYTPVDPARWPDLLAYTEDRLVYGHPGRVVVTYNPALWEGQIRGFRHQQLKMEARIRTLQERLARWRADPPPRGRRPTPATVDAHLRRVGRGREPGPFLRWQCTTDAAGVLTLTTHWEEAALAAYQEAHFGKTLLFTDHTDWAAAAMIAAYRGQGSLENGFRQMKDPHFVTFSPMFHWTDQKIRVHAAYCVLALLLASLLHREARAAGFAGGLDALLETLTDLKLVVDLPVPGRRTTVVRLTERTPVQEQLVQHFHLAQYHAALAPTEG